jgi:hypothetical protein
MTTSVSSQPIHPQRAQNPSPDAYMTLEGIPVSIVFTWPFTVSASGSDHYILHGDMRLLGHEEQHALLAIQMSQTFKEALPSLDRKDAEGAAIAASRKELDRKQLELLDKSKLQPVTISSRHYSIKNQKLVFAKANDEQMEEFIRSKVYWLAYKLSGADAKVWLADPYDAEYLGTITQHILEVAQKLASEGWLKLTGEAASSGEKLKQAGAQIESRTRAALDALKAKHAYEAGR